MMQLRLFVWIKYFEDNYKIARIHKIEGAGHMLYLPYWDEIINEIAGYLGNASVQIVS